MIYEKTGMGTYEQTLETNKTINYKVVVEKDQESRDICFVIIDDVLVNIFAIAQYSETITIPDWVRVIKSNAVMDMADSIDPQGLECGELVIPWSVEKIEGYALKYMTVDSITLDPENKSFTLKDGSLYTRDEKTLVLAVWPDGDQDEWHEHDCFYVADGTEEIADGALDNIWFEKLMIPDSVVRFGNLAHCEAFMEDCHGECVVCASADSLAAKYCEKNDIPFEEWDGSGNAFMHKKEDEAGKDEESEDENENTTEMISEVITLGEDEIGSTVLFGSYPQTAAGNDKTPIEWQVLDKQRDKILLISKKGLAGRPYNDELRDVTWENCTLRKWLNGEFLNDAFNATEQKAICRTIVKAGNNPLYDTDPGADTEDRVFLLSILEAEKFFGSNNERICTATEAAINNGAKVMNAKACWWWLRSPGHQRDSAAHVYYGGSVGCGGQDVNFDFYAVRPALWVNLKS